MTVTRPFPEEIELSGRNFRVRHEPGNDYAKSKFLQCGVMSAADGKPFEPFMFLYDPRYATFEEHILPMLMRGANNVRY